MCRRILKLPSFLLLLPLLLGVPARGTDLSALEEQALAVQVARGVLYLKGRHVPKNTAEGLRLMEEAANRGYAPGQIRLGIAFRDGEGGIPPNPQRAATWFSQAANTGNTGAMNLLARLYLDGTGVPQDPEQAYKLYVRGAALGDLANAYSAAKCSAEGTGTAMNETRAELWACYVYSTGLPRAKALCESYAIRRGETPGKKTAKGIADLEIEFTSDLNAVNDAINGH